MGGQRRLLRKVTGRLQVGTLGGLQVGGILGQLASVRGKRKLKGDIRNKHLKQLILNLRGFQAFKSNKNFKNIFLTP